MTDRPTVVPASERPIVVPPGGGRAYTLGAMRSLFKADGAETDDRYCVSEWWLDAGRSGPGPHRHEANEELFYVLEGTMTIQVGDEHVDAERGAFLRIPAGITHDFENRSTARAGILNVFIPGGFEADYARWAAAAADATDAPSPPAAGS